MTLDLANAYLRDVEEEIKKHTQDASSKNYVSSPFYVSVAEPSITQPGN